MARVNVSGYDPETGEPVNRGWWFDPERAEKFEEGTRWDGQQHVSVHTADKFDHEMLYRTNGGRWVLHGWSQMQGVPETYRFLPDDEALAWLVVAGCHERDVREYFDPEEERGPGRPTIGPKRGINFPREMLAELDKVADQEGTTGADLVREFVADGLARRARAVVES